MSELIPISIVIVDRTYRIKTLPRDEEVIRKTVKMINDKVVEFKTLYAGKDMQDYLAMVIIWFATQSVAGAGNAAQKEELLLGLQKLEGILDGTLDGV